MHAAAAGHSAGVQQLQQQLIIHRYAQLYIVTNTEISDTYTDHE